MRGVRRLGLVLRPERNLDDSLEQIRRWAASAEVELVGADGEERLPDAVTRRAETMLATDCDVVLALGGDGTMLGALRLAAPHGVPVLGVNLGRLGYLTEVDAANLQSALSALEHDQYGIELRTALTLEIGRASWRERG